MAKALRIPIYSFIYSLCLQRDPVTAQNHRHTQPVGIEGVNPTVVGLMR